MGSLPKAKILNALSLQHKLSSLASSCGKFPQPSPGLTLALSPLVSVFNLWRLNSSLPFYTWPHTSLSLTNPINKTHPSFGLHPFFFPSSKPFKRGIYIDCWYFLVSLYCVTYHNLVSTFFPLKYLEQDQLLLLNPVAPAPDILSLFPLRL